jgi:diguanylate cyclase (GGDEF)-like protein
VLLGSTLISGLLWGAAAIWLYVPNQPAFSLFLALILVAMTAASTVLLSFHRSAYPVFCTPVIIPLTVQLIADSGTTHTAIAVVAPIYYSLLFLLSRQIYRYSHDAIINGSVRERHALVDHVTAIPNRRAFDEYFHAEWLRATRNRQPLSLILCDIDGFKQYNDRYGHAVGDAVLRAVAGLCRQAARRRTDLAARIGGDEFAIVAADTGKEGAAGIVRDLQNKRELMARNSYHSWAFPTLSIGCCTATPTHDDDAVSLFEQADAALYQAKAAMRLGDVEREVT